MMLVAYRTRVFFSLRAADSASQRTVSARQSRTVLSSLAEARIEPSRLNATDPTVFVWPRNAASCTPAAGSQIRMVLSADAEAILLPSGLKSMEGI